MFRLLNSLQPAAWSGKRVQCACAGLSCARHSLCYLSLVLALSPPDRKPCSREPIKEGSATRRISYFFSTKVLVLRAGLLPFFCDFLRSLRALS
jgi:hypothetical protein